jgi:hypothetical protein
VGGGGLVQVAVGNGEKLRLLSVSHHNPDKKKHLERRLYTQSSALVFHPWGKKEETAIVTAWIAELDKLMVLTWSRDLGQKCAQRYNHWHWRCSQQYRSKE